MQTYLHYSGIIFNIILLLGILFYCKRFFKNIIKKYNSFCMTTNFGGTSGEDALTILKSENVKNKKEYKEMEKILETKEKRIHSWIPFIASRKDKKKIESNFNYLVGIAKLEEA